MPKFKMYQVTAGLMFIASAVITIMLMLDNVIGFIPSIIAIIQGLGIESAKTFFSVNFLTTSSKNMSKKAILGVLALLAFCISLMATVGFGMIMTNSVKNDKYFNSEQYAQEQENRKLQKDLYQQKKKELEQLQSGRDKTIADMEKQRDSWGKNYKSMKENAQKQINSKSKELTDIINSKSTELSQISENLQHETIKEANTAGFSVLYDVLAERINENRAKTKDKKPISSQDIALYVNLIIAIALECFACGFVYLAEQAKKEIGIDADTSPVEIKAVGFQRPSFITSSLDRERPTEKINKIGFQPPESLYRTESENRHTEKMNTSGNTLIKTQYITDFQDINKSDLLAYIDFMYENQKDNISPGFQKIFKHVGAGCRLEEFRKIRGHLERLGIIETTDTQRTKILCTKSECLKRI